MVKSEKISAEETVRHIRRETRHKYNAEEKIRIVLEGLRGEESIVELCRQEGINPNLYYKWSKEFLEAGKARLTGDTKRQANTGEVEGLRRRARRRGHGPLDLLATALGSLAGRLAGHVLGRLTMSANPGSTPGS